jgi:hypothetical protein
MEPKGFMGYPKWGSAYELSIFGHEQYPFNSPNQNNWAHVVYSLSQIGYYFLCRFRHTPLGRNKYVIEPIRFFIYLKKGIAHPLNNYGHKQYPSSSLD